MCYCLNCVEAFDLSDISSDVEIDARELVEVANFYLEMEIVQLISDVRIPEMYRTYSTAFSYYDQ